MQYPKPKFKGWKYPSSSDADGPTFYDCRKADNVGEILGRKAVMCWTHINPQFGFRIEGYDDITFWTNSNEATEIARNIKKHMKRLDEERSDLDG